MGSGNVENVLSLAPSLKCLVSALHKAKKIGGPQGKNKSNNGCAGAAKQSKVLYGV